MRIKRFAPAAFVWAVAAVFGIRLFLFIHQHAVNVLFMDEWDFLARFFGTDRGPLAAFFYEHAPHRQGLGGLVNYFLVPLTHWDSRFQSYLCGFLVFVAMLLALQLKKRLLGPLTYTDALIPGIFLVKSQWEMLIGAPNIAYSAFPLVLLMLYALALIQKDYLGRTVSLLALNFLLIFTGFGIFAGAITIAVFAFDGLRWWRGDRSIPAVGPVVGFMVACLSLALFFVDYRFQAAVDCFGQGSTPLYEYVRFASLLLPNFFGIRTHLTIASLLGGVIGLSLLAVVAVSVRRSLNDSARRPVAMVVSALSGYSFFYMANVSYGRACLGSQLALTSRYATFLIPLFLAAYLFLLTLPVARLKYSLIALFALLLLPAHFRATADAQWLSDGKRAWAECYRAHEDITFCDAATNFKLHPFPENTDLKRKLDYLKKNKLNLFSP